MFQPIMTYMRVAYVYTAVSWML